jgi:hypothetical protein
MLQKENHRPWWNKDCYAVLRWARKAYTESRDSPLSADKREVWRRAEALKRKYINQAKRTSWKPNVNKVGYKNDLSKLCNFFKCMLEKMLIGHIHFERPYYG